jgi:hypothetical protein
VSAVLIGFCDAILRQQRYTLKKHNEFRRRTEKYTHKLNIIGKDFVY